MLDYLKSGWLLRVTFAIDYTLHSNGPSHSSTSLHHLGPNNKYLPCIESIGRVLEPLTNHFTLSSFGTESDLFEMRKNVGEVVGVYTESMVKIV
jgi:hypothetical protein